MKRSRISCFVALAALLVAGAASAGTARGTVFDDLDRDGVRDAGERGLPGVAVSNGVDVVATDDEGGYRIELDPGAVLFVTKPAGWAVPVDADGLPRFYYVHSPDGTPPELGLRYPGIAPTGPLPEAIDFPLHRVQDPDRFRVVWFADTQPQTPAELDYIRDDVIAELVGVDAAFGITVGDIVYDEMSLFPRQNRMIGRIGIPWYNVPGNHELNFQAPDNRHARETFKRVFGPPYFSFEYGKVHFVALDDVYYLGKDAGNDVPHLRGVGNYQGRIEGDQLAWLAADLARVPADRLIVLASHIPPRSYEFPERENSNLMELEPLFRVLEDRAHVLWIAGHMHVAEHHWFGADDGWRGDEPLHAHSLSAVCGSWWTGPFDERGIPVSEQRDGSPNGYYLMDVDGNRATMRFRAASRSPEHQMRIVLDAWFHQYSAPYGYRQGQLSRGPVGVDQLPSTDVVVNLFDGGPRSRVELSVDGGPAVTMRRVRRNDPYVEEHFQRHADTLKPWLRVTASSHVWVADLPADLAPGAHSLTVTAVDDYGLRHRGHQVIEVMAP
jgi:hypothetical protein